VKIPPNAETEVERMHVLCLVALDFILMASGFLGNVSAEQFHGREYVGALIGNTLFGDNIYVASIASWYVFVTFRAACCFYFKGCGKRGRETTPPSGWKAFSFMLQCLSFGVFATVVTMSMLMASVTVYGKLLRFDVFDSSIWQRCIPRA